MYRKPRYRSREPRLGVVGQLSDPLPRLDPIGSDPASEPLEGSATRADDLLPLGADGNVGDRHARQFFDAGQVGPGGRG